MHKHYDGANTFGNGGPFGADGKKPLGIRERKPHGDSDVERQCEHE